ncbi:hypothetical protein [Deinococcus frigens]|uniref:hypothetical protein n=1 Tax=Deinococcus frigens TaxID=249403 RepID=UPI00049869DA|nr:hypothetical protein [Deinococcus frigens]
MLKATLIRALALALTAATFARAQTTPADSGTPIFVQPPQQQTQELVPSTPQTLWPQPAPEQFTVWGGLSSEVLILPELFAAVSAPVLNVGQTRLNLRAGMEVFYGLIALNAEALIGGNGGGLYGGPSTALMLGANSGWAAGGVLGYRSRPSQSRLGFFAESKLRYLVLRNVTPISSPLLLPGQTPSAPADLRLLSPGLRLGVTYRF